MFLVHASNRSRAVLLHRVCLPQQIVVHLSTLAEIPLERFQTAISPVVCRSLQQQGYAVVDNLFGPVWSSKLKQELEWLKEQGKMRLNSTHLVKQGGTELLEKQHVYEAELQDAEVQQVAPLCQRLNEDSTMRTMLSLFMPHLRLDSQAIKLQCNAGNGGCFPLHYDSDEQVDGRRVTAIFYLNTDWQPSHGGQLQLFPFPDDPVAIAPIADRLVLFSSCRMLHRVLPSLKERYCFTIWLSQSRRMHVESTPPLGHILQSGHDSLQQASQLLLRPDVRHHLSKLIYAEEWAKSIQESHPVSEARSATLAKHWNDVNKIKEALHNVQNILLPVMQNRKQYDEVMAGKRTAWF
ncbi:hypothetical protein ABBQ32_010786 [Trebouxia sp. C0010 RCD-2024]